MDDRRPPYAAALAVAAAVLALYVATLAPTTAFWDTSEYIATAWILGIPHPPGNPLFVVLARTWSLLLAPLGLPVAVRINLFAAATSAAASAFFFLVAHRFILPLVGHRGRAIAGGAAATLVGATAYTVWGQSTVNEKVYTLSVAIIAAVTWLALRWRDRHEEEGSERLLLWAFFLMALGSTNHLMSVLPLPAFGLLILFTAPLTVLRPRFLGRAVLLGVIGLSLNFFLPIRAAQNPVINEGDATCESATGAAVAIYSNGMAGCPALAYNLARKQYQKPPVTDRQAPFSDQLANYWQYFDWQWARGLDASQLVSGVRLPITLLFLVLGLAGLWAAWRADRVGFVYMATLMVTLTVALIYYLNFKYGYSLAPDIPGGNTTHEVRERDYFFVASFMVWGVLSGVGLSWVWGALSSAVGNARRWVLTAPVLAVALIPLGANWAWASRADDYAAHDWAYDLLMSVEPYAVLFTNGDNDTFPLWYMQEVEGVRKDVTVVVGQYLQTDWYPKQLKELTEPERQRPYDAPELAAIYPAPSAPPKRSVTSLEPAEMDAIGAARLSQDVTVAFPGRLAVTYPSGTILTRDEQVALAFIHDSIDDRPIYFAASGGLMQSLGLSRWGVRHGLAVKLDLRKLDQDTREGLVKGSPQYGAETFDLDTSLALYQDIYRFRSIRNRAIWADRSTLNIPWYFYALSLQLSDVAKIGNQPDEVVNRLRQDALAFQVVADGGERGTPGEGVS